MLLCCCFNNKKFKKVLSRVTREFSKVNLRKRGPIQHLRLTKLYSEMILEVENKLTAHNFLAHSL